MYENLQSRITREAVLVTDEYNSYKYLCRKESIEHIVVNSKCHSSKIIKRLSRLSEKPLRVVFEFGLLDFLIAYAIREMYNYTVLVLDTQR